MRALLLMLLALPALAAPVRRVPCVGATCTAYSTPAKAFAAVLATRPRILGIGEVHQIEDSTVPSALSRFTKALLPVLAPKASELVVETWITDGRCGSVETQVVAEVKVETKRPVETPNEVVALALAAKARGVVPGAVNLTCDEYRSVLAEDGSLDDEALLTLIARLLSTKASRISRNRHAVGDDRIVAIYGGALHNDLTPDPEIAQYSFGPALVEATGGRYVELDLYVPEYVADDPDVTKEPWFPATSRRVRGDATLLVERSPSSFVLVFPETRHKR